VIHILINDKPMAIKKDSALLNILKQEGYGNACFAVAINRNFIPQSKYQEIILNEGDHVEIVAPMQGG
jgi:sulfur carrier protein